MSKPSYDPKTKIWSGPKIPPLYNPNQGLGQLMLKVLQQTPDAITQISADTDVAVTCKEMYSRSINLVKYLTKCGIKEGDRIGFVTANSENLAPIVFACFTMGFPINPLSPVMNERDIVQMYSKIEPKMIFCDADNLKVVQNAVNEMKSDAKVVTVMDKVDGHECVTDILKQMENETVDDFEFPLIDPNSTAAILCSSGSTGFPKGICKSHRQIITDLHQFWSNKTLVVFQESAIFWLSGFATLIISVLYKHINVCSAKTYDPEMLVDFINKYQISTLFLSPYMLVSILKIENLKPLESIKCVLVGSTVVSDDLCRKFTPLIPNGQILSVYGITEQDFLAINYANQNYGSSGFPINNVDIKIIDDDGCSCGPNEKGEIYTRIPVHFTEYFGEPVKTAETFDDDWFKTGDLGYFDDNNYIYVVERKKELLKYKGYHITSSEIEVILNGFKGIVSSCVVGVPEPHTGNDILYAFVILDGSISRTEQDVLDYVNGKVIDVKRIRGGVYFLESFPLGLTGKVDKKKVREMAQKLYTTSDK